MDVNHCITRLKQYNRILNPEVAEEAEFIKSNNFKIKYYKVFMIYMFVYWSMETIVLSLRPFLALYHEWIFTLAHQFITLVSMTYLFITLSYSVEVRKFERRHEGALVMPLPFHSKHDPKL
jgi:ABC-type amino acid transport system permease subunit